MRAFRGPGAPGAIAAIALAVSPPTAAQAPDRDAAPPGTGLLVQEVAPGNGSLLAGLGDHVCGPIDVETPPGDNGRPVASIYRFDEAGNLIATYSQLVSGISAWGHRDLESDDPANVPGRLGHLWGGEENGYLVRYAVDGNGDLDAGTAMTLPAVGTIRALARDLDPDSASFGHFFTADFTGPILEFDESGTVHASFANPGKTVYGMALDATDSTRLWLHSQNAPAGSTNMV